jgi:hypothetical protein
MEPRRGLQAAYSFIRTSMSVSQTGAELPAAIIVCDETDERRKLEGRIWQAQRDERCVRRAAMLMALFVALDAVALAFGALYADNFGYGGSGFVFKLVCELGLASLICLGAFVAFWFTYRRKVHRLREECRRLVTKLLESHLRKPQIAPLRGSLLGAGARPAAQDAPGGNGSPPAPDAPPAGAAQVVKPSPETNSFP